MRKLPILTEFQNSCLLWFAERLFNGKVADETVAIYGFGLPYRRDRDSTKVGEKVGGYVNERWCDSANGA